MRITHIKCPGCGKSIDIDWDWSYFLCQYCHAKCVILSHNHPESPQETLERLHGEAWQSIEEGKHAKAYEQYREILQHQINDGEAWHGRALAVGLRSLDKENLRAAEVIASFDEGLRRDSTPRSQIIYADHALALARQLHHFHYLQFRRAPLLSLRWTYYREASDFALRLLRKSLKILQPLLNMPDQLLALLSHTTEGYRQVSLHEQARQLLRNSARLLADIDRALLHGSLRLKGTHWKYPKWFCVPRREALQLRQEYHRASQLALGIKSQSPTSAIHDYFFCVGVYLTINLAAFLLCCLLMPWSWFLALLFSLVGFFGFFFPIRNRLWAKQCYANDIRAGVYDYH